jgi:biopolymer transport protein TolR
MGAALPNGGSEGGGRRRRRRGGGRPMSDINVTPMVDVMLVLLIIFMVAAPLLTVGVPIDLPKSQANPLKTDKPPLTISVKEDGKIFMGESELTLEEIGPKLSAASQVAPRTGPDEVIFVRGDRRAVYGALMKVMGKIAAAGFKHISLITELEERP